MPRTPKSTKSSQRWTMLSFFSSGFSDRPTTTTTTTATTPSSPRTEREESGSKEESPTSSDKEAEEEEEEEEEESSWIMLHDRDSTPFWLDKSTGHWTYDGINLYGPPAPAAAATGYALRRPHHQQQQLPPPPQQQQQHVSFPQPAISYYAPDPYTAVYPSWRASPSVATAAVVAPGTNYGAPGVAPIFF